MTVLDAHRIASAFNVQVDVTAHLYNSDGVFFSDVSEHLIVTGSQIEYELGRRIPGTARLAWGLELPTGAYRVQLAMTLTDVVAGDTATVDIGRWVMETPSYEAGSSPPVWTADCYDPLVTLDNQIPRTWYVPDGAVVSDAILDCLDASNAGTEHGQFTGADAALVGPRIWPLDGETAWLDIIDELALAAGWNAVWSDRSGRVETDEWQDPKRLQPLFSWSTDDERTVISSRAKLVADTWGVPNQWIIIQNVAEEQTEIPEAGRGIVTYRNERDGPASIEARGREVNCIVFVDAADHAALELEAARRIGRDSKIARQVEFHTSPQPTLWHATLIELTIPELSIYNQRAEVSKWSLPLDGRNMSITADLID